MLSLRFFVCLLTAFALHVRAQQQQLLPDQHEALMKVYEDLSEGEHWCDAT